MKISIEILDIVYVYKAYGIKNMAIQITSDCGGNRLKLLSRAPPKIEKVIWLKEPVLDSRSVDLYHIVHLFYHQNRNIIVGTTNVYN